MISFPQLGRGGRLGNQMFQYAFLRTQAERLGVTFYCPSWAGDTLFKLNDRDLREPKPTGIIHRYDEPVGMGINHKDRRLPDNTEITGVFVGKDNFDKNAAQKWYTFNEDLVRRLRLKYSSINFDTCMGIHIRLGDKLEDNFESKTFFVPRLFYYRKALKRFARFNTILVFSDEIEKAKMYLRNLPYTFIFMDGNSPGEDLYLMTQCHDFISGSSTLSWWASFLNTHENKIIVFPKEGEIRPHGIFRNRLQIMDGWFALTSLIPVLDSYPVVTMKSLRKLYHGVFIPTYHYYLGRIGRNVRKRSPTMFKILKPFFPDRKA